MGTDSTVNSPEVAILKNRIAALEERVLQLQQDNQTLRQFFDCAPLSYHSLNEQALVADVNLTWLDTLGYTREEVVGKPVNDFLHPQSRALFQQAFPSFKTQGEIHGAEFQLLKKDGATILAALDGKISRDDQGRFLRTHCILTDISERRRIEKELHLCQFVINQFADEVYWLSEDGHFLYTNTQACRALGYSPEELLGMTVYDINPIYSRADQQERMRRLTQEKHVTFETLHQTKEGLNYPVEVRTIRVQLDNQTYICSFARDITERKLTEARLMQDQLIIKDSPAVLFRWRAEEHWSIEVVSENVRQFGYEAGELLSGSVLYSSLIHPDDLERVKCEVDEYTASGTSSFQQEYRIMTRDGRMCWADDRTSVERDENGQVTHYQGIVVDITDRKRMEETLRASEARARTLVDFCPVGIFMADPDGRIVYENPATRRILGVTGNEVLGEKANAIHPDDKDRILTLWRQFVTGLAPEYDVEFRFVRPDQSECLVHGSAARVQSGQQLTGFVGTVMDISEQRRAERAEAANRAKSQFLANVSHEIRTPLNAIIGMTHLAMETSNDQQRQRFLRASKNGAENLLGILNDILDFSKIESGQVQLDCKPFDLGHLLDAVLATFDEAAREKGLALEGYVAGTLPQRFIGDELHLKQILLNLVGNALKFTDRGSVTLEISQVEGAGDSEKTPLDFKVCDTGTGIAPDMLESIFHSFEQADNSFTRRYGGVGLGLAIGRQLAQLMGGRLWVESQVGQGSTFHLTLDLRPVAEERTASQHRQKSDLPAKPAQLHILVVDDNELNRDVVKMILEKTHRVNIACDGLEALVMLSRATFDVILMDVQMPVMDGLSATAIIRALETGTPLARTLPEELVRSLRESRAGGHVTIVAMTAHAMAGDRERCLTVGMDGYMAKPFQPAQLLEMLDTLAASSDAVAEELQSSTASQVDQVVQSPQPTTVQQVAAYLHASTGLKLSQVDQLLSLAQRSVIENLSKAREALAREDHEAMGLASHSLKGTLLQCGLHVLAAKAEEIHAAVRSGGNLSFGELLDTLDADLSPFIEQTDSQPKPH